MSFSLRTVIPWGRSFEEYVAMFDLKEADLSRRILGCGDGPSSFNAIATRRMCRIVSADPIYQFCKDDIAGRIEQTAASVADQLRRNSGEFAWSHFKSVEDVIATRMSAMQMFLDDYDLGRGSRYVGAALPALPFERRQFSLALCSHFLFLYSEHYDAEFHIRSLLELTRVAEEVRVFPLLELGSRPSRHLNQVIDAIEQQGCRTERLRVPYEFQRGGNEMLRVMSP